MSESPESVANAAMDSLPETPAPKSKMKIEALGSNIVIRKFQPDSKVGALYIPEGSMERPWGEILHIGPGREERRIKDGDTQSWEPHPICGGVLRVGDKVIYTQGIKVDVPEAEGTVFIVEEDAIVAVVRGA